MAPAAGVGGMCTHTRLGEKRNHWNMRVRTSVINKATPLEHARTCVHMRVFVRAHLQTLENWCKINDFP